MRILLLGEFSSFHRYLKEGLIACGEKDVTLFADGDGWKKIAGQDDYLYQGSTKLTRAINFFNRYRQIKGYDVVQLINTSILPALLSIDAINFIKKNNGIISLCAVGGDAATSRAYWNNKFEYSIYDEGTGLLKQYDKHSIRGKFHIYCDRKIVEASNIIIPGLYEYAIGYLGNPKLYKCIPEPINIDAIKYEENIISQRVIFFHGINDELKNGTNYIRNALSRLKEEYPNDVDIVINGHMPFDEYISLLRTTNVVVDQCRRYGYGINAGISMAMGKVVMTGAREETLHALGVDTSPLICTYPDETKLYLQCKKILENKSEIKEIGLKTRKYCEAVHSYKKIAKEYLQAWRSVL